MCFFEIVFLLRFFGVLLRNVEESFGLSSIDQANLPSFMAFCLDSKGKTAPGTDSPPEQAGDDSDERGASHPSPREGRRFLHTHEVPR